MNFPPAELWPLCAATGAKRSRRSLGARTARRRQRPVRQHEQQQRLQFATAAVLQCYRHERPKIPPAVVSRRLCGIGSSTAVDSRVVGGAGRKSMRPPAARPLTTDDADATRRGTREIFGYRPPRDVAVRIACSSPITHPSDTAPHGQKSRVTEGYALFGSVRRRYRWFFDELASGRGMQTEMKKKSSRARRTFGRQRSLPP